MRRQFRELLLFDALGGIAVNDKGDRVYYAEINRIMIYIANHERTRIINSEKLRTNEGDKAFVPRLRKAKDAVIIEEV